MRYALSNVLGDPFWLTTMPMAIVGWAVALVGSILNNAFDSSRFPVFSWWGIAFEMVAILLTFHVAFSNEIRRYRQAILVFLGIATVYTTNSTNNFVWRDNSSSGAAAAGNILLSVINFIWILYFGTTQDEPVHMYIDSFAMNGKTAPSHSTRGEKRSNRGRDSALPGLQLSSSSGTRAGGASRIGTFSHPYRMSDVPRNFEIGAPVGFSHQTNPNNPSGRDGTQTGADPLNSTYLYSVDQLNRHGLSGHEVANQQEEHSQRLSMGTTIPDNAGGSYLVDEEIEDLATRPIAKARARFSYDGLTSDGELSFKEGEFLDVCDMTGNWWFCKNGHGDVGICPRNYLEITEAPLV